MKKGFIAGIAVLFCAGLLLQGVSASAKEKELVIGLIPEINIFKQKERYKPLGEYLTKKTGMDIRFTILSRYGNIIDRFEKEKMDGAFFGSFTGACAISRLGVVPLARPVNLDNTSTYHGLIFVRKDSNIKDARDMKGKSIAFVERATTAGYVFPLAYLGEQGIKNYKNYFRYYYFAGSHDAVIRAVLEGNADIGAAKHSVYDMVKQEDARVEKELVVIGQSASVPSNGLSLRRGIDQTIRKKLQDALLHMHDEPEGQAVLTKFRALRFVETTAKDYEAVHELARKAGIDIKKYNWSNE